MKKIVLLCAAGMSTSMMVKRMRAAAQETGYDCEINAYAMSEAKEVGSDADMILLGPQVRFSVEKIRQECPNVPVEAIDTKSYGMMDGHAVLAHVKEVVGE